MSYDQTWLPVVEKHPRLFWNDRDAKTTNRLSEFQAEADRLWAKGNYVTLAAGKNYLHDDLFLFANEADAMDFYEEGFRHYEVLSEDQGYLGFDRVALYVGGHLVEEKAVEPSKDEK